MIKTLGRIIVSSCVPLLRFFLSSIYLRLVFPIDRLLDHSSNDSHLLHFSDTLCPHFLKSMGTG
jgi:hypothetical protein